MSTLDTEAEKQLYDLVPKFIDACLAYRAKAPCNLVVEVEVDAEYHEQLTDDTVYLHVSKTRDGAHMSVQRTDGHGQRIEEGLQHAPASVRLAIMAQAKAIFADLAAAASAAKHDLQQAQESVEDELAVPAGKVTAE